MRDIVQVVWRGVGGLFGSAVSLCSDRVASFFTGLLAQGSPVSGLSAFHQAVALFAAVGGAGVAWLSVWSIWLTIKDKRRTAARFAREDAREAAAKKS